MADFTLSVYQRLLKTFLEYNYYFYTVNDYVVAYNKNIVRDPFVILRHDVDKKPNNSLKIARIESSLGIRSTYYFRRKQCSDDSYCINQILALGHEIGYHYECLADACGDVDKAYLEFQRNLAYFRTFCPVTTVCMHGSPMSKFDSRDMWKKYDYKRDSVICEPYFDIDFDKIFYLTDTARMWDGDKYSRRDKVCQQESWRSNGLSFHSTEDIIRALYMRSLPDRLMITTHPQRWTDFSLSWMKELLWQRIKNNIKYLIIK